MLDRVPLLYAGNELGIACHDVGAAFPADRQDSSFLKDVKALDRSPQARARPAPGELHRGFLT